MYSFYLLTKLYNTAAAIIIVNIASGFVRSVGARHGNILFHMPNIRSIVVLVRIWTTLYLSSGRVFDAISGVIKYCRHGYPLSPSNTLDISPC